MVFKSGDRVEAKVSNPSKVGIIVKASGLQRSVLLGHTTKGDGRDDIAGVYLRLYPGDEIEHLAKIIAKARKENEKHKDFMMAERHAFQTIFIMAPLQRESGRALRNKHDTTKPRRSSIFSGEYSAVESTAHRYP